MAAKANPAAAMRRTRADAVKLAAVAGRRRLKRLLVKAERDLTRRLKEASGITGPGGDSFTAVQLEVMLRQVRQVADDLQRGMREVVVGQGAAAADAAAKNTLDYMQNAERKYVGVAATLPLKHAQMFDRVARRTHASVLRRLSMSTKGFDDPKKARKVEKGILERYGESVIGNFEDKLQLAVATKKPLREVREELKAASPFLQQAPAHWAERIVRTETMAAYSAAGWESVREAQQTLGDMVKILSATFDGRTGWDSYGLHGQIRRPDEAFGGYDGRQYMHPPNRPNDREIVVPHRISWPIPPALEPLGDGAVAARWTREGRKGSPPARPRMTTVPREQFGKSGEP